jgi:hypothetical protein
MRVWRGLGSLLALIAGLTGVPAALVVLGGNPMPADMSWASFTRALLRPDDGTILIGMITVIGWTAWLIFAVSLLTELVAVVSGFRIRILIPGLGGPQRLVAVLLLAVLAMLTVPVQPVEAVPATPAPPSPAPRVLQQERSSSAVTSPRPDAPAPTRDQPLFAEVGATPVTHVVQRGDDLWSLAEHYYGNGRDWRKIASANPKLLSGGPDRLQPGWKLLIPDGDTPAGARVPGMVVVRPGDSLSSPRTFTGSRPGGQRSSPRTAHSSPILTTSTSAPGSLSRTRGQRGTSP